MTQAKITKKALIASVFSLFICISMLIGSTFAWFTDTATTSVNTIKSGNLEVDLVDEEGKTVVGRTLEFVDKDENKLWEPGCTYTLENVYVVNNGNLALEYEIVISGLDGNAKLLEVIEWTITGTENGLLLPGVKSEAISITGHMKASANNDYMNLTLDGIAITVNATQAPYEKDSFGNTYDEGANEGAEEIKTATVVTAEQLQNILTQFTDAGSGDATVNIAEDIVLAEGEIWTPVTVDGYNGADIITVNGNGHKISGLNAPLFSGGFAGGSGIVINDLTIDASNMTSSNSVGSGSFVEYADSMNVITLKNCHLTNSKLTATDSESRTGGLVGYATGYVGAGEVFANITIEDCSVVDCQITGGGSVAGIIGHAGANANTKTVIKNCTVKNTTITSTKNGSWRVGVLVGTANGGDVVITGTVYSGNTVAQSGATSSKTNDLIGRFALNGTGEVTIDSIKVG